MQRTELEHLIRAAASITNENELVITSSQAILGSFPNASDELLRSMKADIYPRYAHEKSDLIEASIGEDSVFADAFGYYTRGLGPEAALLPQGWEDRPVKIQSSSTDLKIGWCLEPHDLAASKLATGREKDRDFISALLQHSLVDRQVVTERIERMSLAAEHRHRMLMMLLRLGREVNGLRHVDGNSDVRDGGDAPPSQPAG